MKLLIHCLLLIIYIGTTNTEFYTLRDNLLQLWGHQSSVAQKPLNRQSTEESKRPLREASGNFFRNGKEEEGWETLFDEHSITNPESILRFTTTALVPRKIRVKKIRYRVKPNEMTDPTYIIVDKHDDTQHSKKTTINYDLEKEDSRQTASKDIEIAKAKAKILKNAQQNKVELNDKVRKVPKFPIVPKPEVSLKNKKSEYFDNRYEMDPVLNYLRTRQLRRKWLNQQNFRRADEKKSSEGEDTSAEDSEIIEQDWKDEFKNSWAVKKFEALNSSVPPGDMVNMVAARPWGVPCGDPNQHDVPWGSCTLAPECDPEFRIYRGDYFCGRARFVCCAVMQTNYDLYQGIDISFAEDSMPTDSSDERNRKNKKKKKKDNEKQKRENERLKRKRKMKKQVFRIIREVKKLLESQYKNGTKMKKKKTNLLKKFIKSLKKQYQKDKTAVKELHEEQLMKIDAALQEKLNQIKQMNEAFMKNATFRDIIVNGTISKTGARMLVQAYPELWPFFAPKSRRRIELELPILQPTVSNDKSDDLLAKSGGDDYDVEYGYLYE